MFTYSYTFCTIVHLGGYYISEMQYKVVFHSFNYFSSCSHSWFINIIYFCLYYNDWTTFAEQIINYLNEIVISCVNIKATDFISLQDVTGIMSRDPTLVLET